MWYGHVNRLPEETPARIAINYLKINKDARKTRGGQKTTWQKLITEDLNEISTNPKEIESLVWDRSAWRQHCRQMLR